jgi:hypothetical protein
MTTQQTRTEADGITVASITYASPRGGEVPALVVIPKGTGPFLEAVGRASGPPQAAATQARPSTGTSSRFRVAG